MSRKKKSLARPIVRMILVWSEAISSYNKEKSRLEVANIIGAIRAGIDHFKQVLNLEVGLFWTISRGRVKLSSSRS